MEFRVPLHAQQEGAAGAADALGHAVVRPRFHLQPGDTPRPLPDITFEGTAFVSSKPLATFLEECERYGVKLRNCTSNGAAINSVGLASPMFIGPGGEMARAA